MVFYRGHTVWSSELDTLLMWYGAKFTSYRIKSVSNSLNQIVDPDSFGLVTLRVLRREL